MLGGGALEGLRVLDVATLFPAPLLAAMLADLGADVVKVEPLGGDPLRHAGVKRNGRATVWTVAGRAKRSIALDLDDASGCATLQRLTAVADVVVTNQPQPVLERWGCTYEEIAARNAGAVVVRVTGFGVDGPYADRAASGTLAEAFAGLTNMIGEADGPPVLPSVPLGDTLGALVGLNGVLAALYARARGACRGQLVDVSLYESVLPLLATTLAGWRPGEPAPARSGSTIPGMQARGTFETSDGRWIALSGGTEAQAARVRQLIGDEPLAAWIAARPVADALDALIAAKVPASEVNDLERLSRDPQVVERGSLVDVDQPGIGMVRLPAPAPKLSATPLRPPAPAPELGEHSAEVLRDWLGE